jgi:hypothetical protein
MATWSLQKAGHAQCQISSFLVDEGMKVVGGSLEDFERDDVCEMTVSLHPVSID